jgi:hypothetical protein
MFKILITTISYIVGGPGMNSQTALHTIVTQFGNREEALTAVRMINAQKEDTQLLIQRAVPMFDPKKP